MPRAARHVAQLRSAFAFAVIRGFLEDSSRTAIVVADAPRPSADLRFGRSRHFSPPTFLRTNPMPHRLTLDGVRKSFGATAALRGVSPGVGAGVVHALIGGNGPEGQRKLAGGRAKRKPPDHRMKTTSAPDGAAEPRGISRAPAGAHDFLTKRSGGSRSLRQLHHRLISIRPPGGDARKHGVSWVGWASRLPCCASRAAPGERLSAMRAPFALGCIPRDAEYGRRDAHPTRRTPLGFFTRLRASACSQIARRHPLAMILEKIPAVNSLTATEKLLLVSELWDDLDAHPNEVPVSREQIAELDRRMEEYRRDPSQVTSWAAIQGRILGRILGSE